MTRRRHGFALLAVLWIVIGAAALALPAALAGREAVGTVRNRMLLTQALWLAEGCAEVTRAVIAEALALQTFSSRALNPWANLDRMIRGSPLVSSCGGAVSVRSVGTGVDLNTATAAQLRRLMTVLGIDSTDALVAALLDWRDEDNDVRAGGAEREWYVENQRASPRNGPFAHVRELQLVRGFESLVSLDSVVTVEPGPIALNSAPLTVIASLPGVGSEILARLAERRVRGERLEQLIQLEGGLSPAARSDLHAHYGELHELTTIEPPAWIVTATGTVGLPSLSATIELRVVAAENRHIITRRKVWP